jgi:hypothetical protein
MARFPRGRGLGGRDCDEFVRAVPGVSVGRPPAVAVTGLRRSGRTGNNESPCGRFAPARQARPLRSD